MPNPSRMNYLKKRYRNYLIGLATYVLVHFLLFLTAGSFPFDKIKTFFLIESIFVPGSVILANFLFDKKWGYGASNIRGGLRAFIKVLLSLIVIIFITILSNEIGESIGFIDDDTLAFGDLGSVNAYWTNVVTNSLITLILCIPAFIREDIIDKKNLEVSTLHTRLDTLKLELYSSNVKPHFIFNTLNGIVSLIHDEPNKAEKMVLYLSDFLRSSLFSADASSHCVKDEFSALEDYLRIEQIRFNDNFTFEIKLSGAVRDFIVPKFFLLPIIENAIKYNRNEKDIQIILSAYEQDDKVLFEVSDSGVPFPEKLKYNAGINGTLSLLRGTYGDAFELIIENQPRKVLRIEVQHV